MLNLPTAVDPVSHQNDVCLGNYFKLLARAQACQQPLQVLLDRDEHGETKTKRDECKIYCLSSVRRTLESHLYTHAFRVMLATSGENFKFI